MKTFTSTDNFKEIGLSLVKRDSPYAKRDDSELPEGGEIILLDEIPTEVKSASFSPGDESLHFFPHICIYT